MSEELEDKPRKRGGNPAWTKGKSGNPNGRPLKGMEKANQKPRVKLRSTLAKAQSLEHIAFEIIEEHLKNKEGKKSDFDKSKLDAAKFIISKIESLHKSCLQEELAILGVRQKNQEAADTLEEIQEEDQESTPRFSMEIAESTLKH